MEYKSVIRPIMAYTTTTTKQDVMLLRHGEIIETVEHDKKQRDQEEVECRLYR